MCTVNNLQPQLYIYNSSFLYPWACCFDNTVPAECNFLVTSKQQSFERKYRCDLFVLFKGTLTENCSLRVTFLQCITTNVCSTPASNYFVGLSTNISCASTSWSLAIKMYWKCDDWLIKLCLVASCSRDRSWEWVIPTWICPAPLFPSPCWIWVQSPAALFASPRFSPTASGAPSAGVSGRARTGNFTTNLQHVGTHTNRVWSLITV